MQAILFFLALSAFLGARSGRFATPLSDRVLMGMCLALALALTSRRVV